MFNLHKNTKSFISMQVNLLNILSKYFCLMLLTVFSTSCLSFDWSSLICKNGITISINHANDVSFKEKLTPSQVPLRDWRT